MWEKVRGIFLMPSNGKNVTNFFSPNICVAQINYNICCITGFERWYASANNLFNVFKN